MAETEETLSEKDYIVHLFEKGLFHILERILTSLPLNSLLAFRTANSGMTLITIINML